ncbi:uncharacterized protein LTR77_008899 [Saxophila tyrrhenica]|uniref:Major facilitator superfamily (MFS) profile domain-containing protein n=1 Tax=Saxophila tyrrhenica TaxID=1690608 RepID=A0AAV9NZC7_9PEZI|nr:hypothetical protein LTR77_008899 [Saxophila tyrrhenica]
MATAAQVLDPSESAQVEYLEDEIEKDFHRNLNARIRNPLHGFTQDELDHQASMFCDTYGFQEDLGLFQKAARVAQKPDEFEQISCLTEEDKYHIRRETTRANGPNLSFPVDFGIENREWLIGVINSAPTLFGTASAFLADPVNNLLGHRGTIFFTNMFVAFTQNWWELLLCRLFMGLGMGIKISTIPIYTSEVSPASIRGGLVTSFQLWVAFGIMIGFSSNLVFKDIGPLAWRFQLAAAFAPAVPLFFLVWFVPESPRWLMKKGRYQKAFAAFCRIRNSKLIAAREIFYAHCQIVAEDVAFEGQSIWSRAWELFSVPRIRRATFASAWIVISQQFSGINIMAFYSSTIFSQAGYTVTQSLLASFGFGVVTFVFSIPAVYTMDTFGRRNLLLFTFPNMAWCLLAAGLFFLMPVESSARVPLIALFIYMFTAFYSPGIGPIPSIYFSESFPLSHREIGSAFTICVNNGIGSALGLTFPSLLAKITPTGAFGLYAGLNLLAFSVIFFIVPETKKRTLEELDYVFGVPTTQHGSYQLRKWLPWFVKQYVFWQKDAVLEPLYHDDKSS